MTKLIFIAVLVFVLFHCQKDKDKTEIWSKQIHWSDQPFEIDSISLPIGLKMKAWYRKFSVPQIGSSGGMFFGYNGITHSIDVIDLEAQMDHFSIPLDREGPNGVPEVRAITAQSVDSVFLLSETAVFLVSKEGKVKKKWIVNIGEKEEDFFTNFLFFTHNPGDFFFANGNIYCRTINYKYSTYGEQPEKYFSGPILAQLSLKDGEVKGLPLAFPSVFQQAFYGFMEHPCFTFSPNLILAGFPINPNLEIFNSKTESVQSIHLKAIDSTSVPKQMNWKDVQNVGAKMQHILTEPEYLGLYCDWKSGHYFRLHFGPDRNKVIDFQHATLTKPLFITEYNEAFDLIREEQLAIPGLVPQSEFCNKGYLYLAKMPGKEEKEEHLSFLRIKVHN